MRTNPERSRSHGLTEPAGDHWSENPLTSTAAVAVVVADEVASAAVPPWGTAEPGRGATAPGVMAPRAGVARPRRRWWAATGAGPRRAARRRSRRLRDRRVAGWSGSLIASAAAAPIDMTSTNTVTRNVDTTGTMLPGPAGPPPSGDEEEGGQAAPSRRQRALVVVAAVLGGLLVLSGIVASLVRIPYDAVAPGTTRAVGDVITVRGHETFPPEGEIMYATVSVRERVSLLQALIGWFDPAVELIPERNIRGNIPPDQYRQLNVEAMSDSKTTAQVLALGRIGYTNLGVGAKIESVADGTPAAGVLRAEDVIVEIDGNAVLTSEDAVRAIRAHQPGETVVMQVRRDGAAPVELSTELAQAEDGRALLGVRLSTKVELPFEITIDSGQIIGPSAGLSYALQLLDLLTAGELTGGLKVAATGELGPSGAVGPVGGVAQKVVAVKRAGADLFLVPKQNEAEARQKAGDGLRIIPVSSFDEALTALGSVQGSNALALARP